MKDFTGKFGFMAALVAMFMTTFTLVSCGGDDGVLEDTPDVTQNDKGHVCSYEVYIEADLAKTAYDAYISAWDEGNGHGKFTVAGGLNLDNFPSDGFLGPNGGVAGYVESWGNGLHAFGQENPTISKHYSITTEKGCEKSNLRIDIYPNLHLYMLDNAVIDKNASFTIQILGYVDGKPVKDKTVSFPYCQVGCVNMGLVVDDPNEGYLYNDLLTKESNIVKW